ncbi:MAG: bifunctional helix-turn-helix transcriptional regulator/GNAT family N-acetyltransferase [Ignavibacteriae bacterium]|nr:bifunctional helix-turn-helix transcriptional regulator/GNAT family N-acetyltransferase [Ignavibacteriota bacterium]MCB9244659.1 bifunctional helix-turn-helix transcriptional regulator/GNAT family N-acetyltransferase [Ignavibacteriales bacterium]
MVIIINKANPMEPLVKNLRLSLRKLVRELDVTKGVYKSTGYSYTECHILIELDQYGMMTIKELAELLNTDKSIVSKTVNSMMKKGLLKTEKNRTDNRQKPLVLTQKGKSEASRLNYEANVQVTEALSILKEEERDIVLKGIQSYSKALNKMRRQAEYQVRPIRKSDNKFMEKIIIDVMTEFGAVGEGYSIKDAEVANMFDAYNNDKSAYFVITRGKEVLGGAGVGILPEAEDVCELKKMYFVPEIRGIGLGEKLLNLCLDAARKIGYKRCYLETLERMPQARGLYMKYGFDPINGPVGCTGHYSCDNYYIRDL